MQDQNDILLKILEAIQYADDKEAFVNEFTQLTQIQAVENLISALPQDQQDSIKNELTANKDNPEKVSEILKSRFNDEQARNALEDASKNALLSWMQAINPSLSDLQKQKLLELSNAITPQASA